MERLLFTPEEAAAMLGVGRTRVYDLIRTGDLASVKIGRSRRINSRAMGEFVESLCTDSQHTRHDAVSTGSPT